MRHLARGLIRFFVKPVPLLCLVVGQVSLFIFAPQWALWVLGFIAIVAIGGVLGGGGGDGDGGDFGGEA